MKVDQSRAHAFAVACLPLCLAGCASLFANAGEEPSSLYHVTAPQAPWLAVAPGPDDKVYQLAADHSVISVKSVCGQYEDLTLEELTRSMLAGLGDRGVVQSQASRLGTFPALRSEVEGRMDNAPYHMAHTVARIHDCVYDLTMVASPTAFSQHQAEYEAFLGSFREGGRK